MDVKLDKTLEEYVAKRVASGDFASATDLVSDALRMHQERLRQRDHLRREIQKGIDSA